MHELLKHELLNDAATRAIRYLDGLEARRVAPTPEALADLKELEGPLPEMPTDPAAVLGLLDDIGSPATVATAGSRFFGYVIGGSLPVTVRFLSITRDGCAPTRCQPSTARRSSACRRAMSIPGPSTRRTSSSRVRTKPGHGCMSMVPLGCGRQRPPHTPT